MDPTLITIILLQVGSIGIQLVKYIKNSSCCYGMCKLQTRTNPNTEDDEDNK